MTGDKLLKILLIVSLIVNISVGIDLFNAPENKLGVLTKDVEVVMYFAGTDKKIIVSFPKGLTVKNESPRGFASISLFSPYRFSITIATGEDDLVDYSAKTLTDALYSIK